MNYVYEKVTCTGMHMNKCGKEQLVALTFCVHVCFIVALPVSLRLFMYGTCD
jgi:hypothetical protein